jgi:2-succinyl-6-hydroxy-2,4-cyclohexadiene-1-carboxylate synthase
MTAVVCDGRRWEVHVRGAGPPVLLVHGFTGRATSWGTHVPAFARRFRVVAPDLPGHGRSAVPVDPRCAGVEQSADDLATILERLGVAPAHVVGYSLGARIALRLAVVHPGSVRRLVLESPSAGLATERERAARRDADEVRASLLEGQGIAAFVEAWEREPVFASQAVLPPAVAARLRAERLRNRPRGLAASLRGAGQGPMEPLHDRLASVTSATLVIAGALDPAGRARAEAVAAGIPGARLAVVEESGHTPHLETPATFRSLVLEFLKEGSAA